MIRDFSGHLHLFSAFSKKKKLKWVMTSKDSWKVFSNNEFFTISYRIYAFEHSVRTNFLDTEYGFINPSAFFIYPFEMLNENIEIQLDVKKFFSRIYTPLQKTHAFTFFAKNYHELFDSPIQISNQRAYRYKGEGCVHEVLIEGNANEHARKIIFDLERITNCEIRMMNGSPNRKYLFILNLTDSVYGGLEHQSSSVNSFDPSKLDSHEEYIKLLGLLAHEYFHLWNVKRIRPKEFDSFDYQNPVLIDSLWFFEGATSFFDNYVLLKSGLITPEDYLKEIFHDINILENSDGENWMSLKESSLTAWTKYYKQNANSHNTGISYYIKGSLFVLCIDLYIREKSKLQKDFSDVMRFLYSEYFLKQKRGITTEDIFRAVKTSTGVEIKHEFEPILSGRKKIPVYKYLSIAGIKKRETEKVPDLGFSIKTFQNGRQIIEKIFQQKIDSKTDISVGDELIAINDQRIQNDNFSQIINMLDSGKECKLLISRRGKILERKCKVGLKYLDEKLIFQMTPTKNQLAIRKNFFKADIHVKHK